MLVCFRLFWLVYVGDRIVIVLVFVSSLGIFYRFLIFRVRNLNDYVTYFFVIVFVVLRFLELRRKYC